MWTVANIYLEEGFTWKTGGEYVSQLARIEVQEGENIDELIACSRNFRFDVVQAASQPQKQASANRSRL